ncbi:hypothetical protein [Glutamicibacter arilaitensis]|uniref:hypothetical protein n=1 Tax=Glutamicibacter arilaitensis TaxID=256701 RepID=UPI003FD0E903
MVALASTDVFSTSTFVSEETFDKFKSALWEESGASKATAAFALPISRAAIDKAARPFRLFFDKISPEAK